ncbi:Activator of Hsp90 ATPase homolog 1-like protein [Mycobacteroides abscessus subsp. bolletii]|nr:SRPBCC family protein [Mycobacteroides abscessus]AMU21275.1 polyketide cyclase [Mycobacteroides abscessus]MDO2971127.1 SRPBCC family protein [Mycobacteroides abscessus subsp. bolletii]MDO3071014.1 SRPBCC family protein [Mycobacteroides abscessus subsp. bolletii]MDO3078511.1 SRPBCC family protein [Mycobacteroides abscessus subsp. bolletii]UEA50404.1 SRPBCC family protein [Mycobacteroides abscessus subsp. abscessus]
MIDVQHQLNSVRRSVGTKTFQARQARVVTVSQTYDTAADDLWEACTNAERIARWFLPITGDLRAGGRYSLQGNASGTVLSCDPPRSFMASWEAMGAVSWIEVTITPEPEDPEGRATFTLEHISDISDDDEHWLQFGPGAVGVGWDSGLLGLAGYLAAPNDRITPEEGAAWAAGAEGRAFMAGSSELWFAAAVASGMDPAQAREMADRTTAAYTAG